MKTETFILSEDYVELCALLKLAGPCWSGGEAKQRIVNGEVQVDGVVETRKKCKIRAGQTVGVQGLVIRVDAK